MLEAEREIERERRFVCERERENQENGFGSKMGNHYNLYL